MPLKPLTPKFIMSLVIDMLIITAALWLYGMYTGVQLIHYMLPLLAIYALLHVMLEMVGVG